MHVSEGGRGAIRRCITAAASLLLVCVFLTELWPAPTAQPVQIALVQYQVSPADYRSEAAFARSVGDLTARAAARGADIVVFPEYLNVFLAAVPLGPSLAEISSLPEALALLQQRYDRPLSIPEYLRLQSTNTRAIMDRVWGALARRHKLWIIAGSSFVAEPSAGPKAQLFNRAFVYNPAGRVAYTQDKVYLTPFEKGTVGLSPGDPADVRTIRAEGLDIGLTICRDTFFDIWNRRLGAADVWIDLKANGVEFDQQARHTFAEALPERIAETDVPYGATVCLTGRFFDLFWEGTSSLVVPSESSPAGYQTKKKTADPAAETLLYVNIRQ